MISSKTRIVAFSHVSNALGTVNPVREIVSIVNERSRALTVCDGAQSAPHLSVNFDELGIDFYAFSGHKMLGPMGIGGLLGKRAILEGMRPYQTGGDMIEFVYDETTTWNDLPNKLEAGTPNAANAVGLRLPPTIWIVSEWTRSFDTSVSSWPARSSCCLGWMEFASTALLLRSEVECSASL